QPHLTLVKVVTNNSGGTKTISDFPLTANGTGTNDITGVSGAAAVTNAAVNADTFALSETNIAGYTASAWVCAPIAASGSNVTLALGQSTTCTISNDDDQPHLTLVKVVTNNSGGTKTISDFPLTANGTGANDITGVSGAAAVTNAAVNADTFALSETNIAGYTASAWVCTPIAANGSNVTLGLGQSTTCTISNDAYPPRLSPDQVVTNNSGGTKTISDFP